MMKKIFLMLLAGLFMLSLAASPVLAADAAMKIGLVDLFRAVNESEQGKKAKTELEAMIKVKQDSLEEKGKAIEKLKAELDKQGGVLSGEAKKAKEEEMERLAREYQRNVADSQNDVRKKEGELTGRIVKELRDIVTDIAQEDKYTMVLEKAEGLVLFADKDLDITDKVIKKFDETKPKSGKK
ncbi:MAG TPA: OmpH family outer membrane protein [Dissulfurispiraceae bacterium]|nr:OmpH family outer membrane protein [Dissulfurispiraceae bacterium]